MDSDENYNNIKYVQVMTTKSSKQKQVRNYISFGVQGPSVTSANQLIIHKFDSGTLSSHVLNCRNKVKENTAQWDETTVKITTISTRYL